MSVPTDQITPIAKRTRAARKLSSWLSNLSSKRSQTFERKRSRSVETCSSHRSSSPTSQLVTVTDTDSDDVADRLILPTTDNKRVRDTMAWTYGGDVGYDLAMAAERVRQQEEHIHQQTRIIEEYKARAKEAEQLAAMETGKRQATNDELEALRQQQLLAGEQRLQPNIHVTETSITSHPATSKKAKRALFSPEASEDDKIRDAIQQLAKIAINDNSLMPKVFNGKRLDPDAMDRWIEHFHRFTAFKQLEDEGKLDLFKLLMTEQAAD